MHQHATGSTPPGWYHAAGDPQGTQRYWDGAVWSGAPVAAGPATATATASPATAGRVAASARDPWWPSWVEPMAWVVSIVKGIPLVLMLIGGISTLLFAGWADSELDRSASDDFDGLGDALELAAGYLFLAIFAFVLFFGLPLILQVRSARRHQPIALLIWSILLILPELSMVVLVRQMRATLFGMIFAAQLAVIIGAVVALRNRSATSPASIDLR
ncbi:MAG: hypothetical protein ACRBI6_18145 [Acidimicrobiales bacterium]